MLSKEKIIKELSNLGVTPPKIIYYYTTDSTNTRAKEYAREHPENRDTVVFIADGQTAGRGRLGRSFVSRSGSGIYMSILSYTSAAGFDATSVTAKCAVSAAMAVESLIDRSVDIKWVNDLYLGGKKLAGILTEGEMNGEGKIAFQVVGMGINVCRSAISEEISDIATSIEDEVGVAPDRSLLAARMIYNCLFGSADHYAEYRARSFLIGRTVTVMKIGESYPALVLDINPDFSLEIKRGEDREKLFSGEISLKV